MMDNKNRKNPWPMDLASVEDFYSIKIESIMSLSKSMNFHMLDQVFLEASREAEKKENFSAVRAYKVLSVICSYHFNPGKSNAFTPHFMTEGKRSLIPNDYIGEQQIVLSKIAEKVDHPLLRARIADSCWYSNRKLYLMAELASGSYMDAVSSFFNKELTYQSESEFSVPATIVDIIERAFAIYSSIGKKKKIPDAAKEIFSLTHKIARDNNDLVAFKRLSFLGQSYELLDWGCIATEAEAMASVNKDKQYAEAVKCVWYLAAHAYSEIGQKESSKRCKVNAVDQTLRMRDSVSSAMAKASWTLDAIGELRSIGGMQAQIESLKKVLQQYEDDSLSEMGQFDIPIDLNDERKVTIEEFKVLELHEMLFHLALIVPLPKKADLHAECLKKKDEYFFSSTFGKSYSDIQGKIIATAPAATLGDNPSEAWFDHESLGLMSFNYHIFVEGFIKPACFAISRYQAIYERHIDPIVIHSEFVPPGHEYIFSNGFTRLIQGDMVAAAHLLIPQLENSLRYVLNKRGSNTAKLNVDLTQEDQSLNQIYTNHKKELDQIFGVDLTYVIHLLFNLKGGPMLRHEIAHGKFTVSHSYQSACIYACWLIYHITCAPLLKNWRTHVSKEILVFTH